MARGGRLTDEKVSFFAFQDIITAVIGILVLIALILALQVNPESEDPGDNPDEALSPVEQITGEREGEGNATVVVDDFCATAIVAEIAEINQQMVDANKTFFVQIEEKNSELEVLNEELERLNLELVREKRKLGIEDSNETKFIQEKIEEIELNLDIAQARIEELEKEEEGLEDRIDSRVVRTVSEMSELELEELDKHLNSQIEQIKSQIENEIRIIPQQNNTAEKPVLVGLAGTEFTIGEFNGEQQTYEVNAADYTKTLVQALRGYDSSKHFFVYFFRPSACKAIVNAPGRGGTIITKNLYKLLCDPKNNLTKILGFKYGFEPIHEEAALLFTDKQPDTFEALLQDL
jgi:hypothetical protein